MDIPIGKEMMKVEMRQFAAGQVDKSCFALSRNMICNEGGGSIVLKSNVQGDSEVSGNHFMCYKRYIYFAFKMSDWFNYIPPYTYYFCKVLSIIK